MIGKGEKRRDKDDFPEAAGMTAATVVGIK